MVLTDRDRRLLEHIWEYDGFLTDYQVKALEFTGLRQAQDRLGKLFHHGYLNRTNRQGRAAHGAMIYWLTRKGAEYVAQTKGIEWKEFRYGTTLKRSMEHDILANDFTLILQQACATRPHFKLIEWINESIFRSAPDRVTYTMVNGKPGERDLIPDRYFLIEIQREKKFRARLLLELDNATHHNKRFADQKVLPGAAYIRSEAYKAHFGINKGWWLIVTRSDKRLGFLKETTERAAGKDAHLFYFTSFDRVSVGSVLTDPIWLVGGEQEPQALF